MYSDPILQTVINVLDKYGPKKLKGRWHSGDSLCVPKNSLPCGFVAFETEAMRDIAYGKLRNVATIVISVVVDMTREYNVPVKRADAHEQVVEMMAAKDFDTFQLRADSVVGALRAHQDLESPHNLWIEVGSESVIEYGVGLEKRGKGIVTAEGILRVELSHDQDIPQHS